MMKKSILTFAGIGLMAISITSAHAADKKQLVILVKGLDNPFFESIHKGCEKWNAENASSAYQCFYTGPASTSDEAGEAQIVGDILGKSDTAAVAISPSNAQDDGGTNASGCASEIEPSQVPTADAAPEAPVRTRRGPPFLAVTVPSSSG